MFTWWPEAHPIRMETHSTSLRFAQGDKGEAALGEGSRPGVEEEATGRTPDNMRPFRTGRDATDGLAIFGGSDCHIRMVSTNFSAIA